jgi:hypothetical protein
LNFYVYAIAVSGTDVYVGGAFVDAAGIPAADNIAKWNGSAWSSLPHNGDSNQPPFIHAVRAIAISGSNVYVGGEFSNAGGDTAADYVALWNGLGWSDVAGAAPGAAGAITGQVHALATYGSNLFVGGYFHDALNNNQWADMVVYWDGANWWNLGTGGFPYQNEGAVNGQVNAIAVYVLSAYPSSAYQEKLGSMLNLAT